MSKTIQPTKKSRHGKARRKRNEEQLICAILHASSPFGIYSIIPSAVVWSSYKNRSQFLGIQALQAMLFQIFSFALFAGVFIIFGVGFYYAAFSGLIARTGVNEPELTKNLIIAAIVGFASLFFFQFVFPLGGVWAGIQLFRGRNFQYPVLGKLAVNLMSRKPFIVKTNPKPVSNSTLSNESKILAGLGHLTVLGGLSLIISPILWATTRHKPSFLTFHLIQASIFQLLMTLIISISFFITWGITAGQGLFSFMGLALPQNISALVTNFLHYTFFPTGWMLVMGSLLIVTGLLALVAAIMAFTGKNFNYPIIGKWLSKQLNQNAYR